MKGSKLQLVCLLFVFYFCAQINAEPLLAFYAIKSIIREYFAKSYHTLDIIQISSNQRERLSHDALNKEIDFLAIKIMETKADNLRNVTLSASTVAIFDSVTTFNSTVHKIAWMNPKRSVHPKHLVYVKNSTTKEIKSIIKAKRNMINVNFLLNESEQSIDLFAPDMYSSNELCRKMELITINRFKRNARLWDNSTFCRQNFKNLHGCLIYIGDKKGIEPSDDSAVIKTFKVLAELLNYKFRYVNYSKFDDDFDITHRRSFQMERGLMPAVPVAFWTFAFTVPPGELYTPFEKMFLMFDTEVWIAIVVTLLIALAIIQIINLCPIKIQNFVFGRNIRTPTLNLQETFLNGGQFRVPQRNFARYLLMLFIIWSLIIRTCYQSELFKYFQADIRKPRIKTVQDLIDNNFTFYGSVEGIVSTFNTKSAIILYRECPSPLECYEIIAEPANKATIMSTIGMLSEINNNLYRSGFSSLELLEEILYTMPLALMFPWFSPLFETFNEKIHQLLSSGLISYWNGIEQNYRGLKFKPDDIGPQVLTMEHVEVGFFVCLIPLALSGLTFLAELAVGKIKAVIQKHIQI